MIVTWCLGLVCSSPQLSHVYCQLYFSPFNHSQYHVVFFKIMHKLNAMVRNFLWSSGTRNMTNLSALLGRSNCFQRKMVDWVSALKAKCMRRFEDVMVLVIKANRQYLIVPLKAKMQCCRTPWGCGHLEKNGISCYMYYNAFLHNNAFTTKMEPHPIT